MKILVLYSTPFEVGKAVLFDVPHEDWDPEFDEDREMLELYIQDRTVGAPYFILTDFTDHKLPEIFDGVNAVPVELRREQL